MDIQRQLPPADVYDDVEHAPEDLITTLHTAPNAPRPPKKASYGVDEPLGALYSSITFPLYLHATLHGKSTVWDTLLKNLPDEAFLQPTLDLGCGRGLVLLKIALRKKAIAMGATSTSLGAFPSATKRAAWVDPAYGIDIFAKRGQSGNSAAATYGNAAAMGVLPFTVLHEASFTERLPFADGAFGLVTASVALHSAEDDTGERGLRRALEEMERVCAPGGRVIVVDVANWLDFKKCDVFFKGQGWERVETHWAGLAMMYGTLPCRVLTGRKPVMDRF